MSCSLRKEATNKPASLLQVPDRRPVNPTRPTPLSTAIAHTTPGKVPQAAPAKPTPAPVWEAPRTGQLSQRPTSDQRLRIMIKGRRGNAWWPLCDPRRVSVFLSCPTHPCGCAVDAASGHVCPWSPHQPLNCTWAAVWAGKLIHVKNNTGKTKQAIFNPSQSHDLEGVSVRLSQSKVLFSCFTGAHRQII